MFKGFLSGLFWGGMVGALVLAVLSLYAPLPSSQAAVGAGVQTPAATPEVESETTPTAPEPKTEEPDTPETGDDAPEAQDPADETESGAVVDGISSPTDIADTTNSIQSTVPQVVENDPAEIDPAEVVAAAEPELDATPVDVTDDIAQGLSAPELSQTTDVASVKLPQIEDTNVTTPTAPNEIATAEAKPVDRPLVMSDKPIASLPVAILKTAPGALGFADSNQTRTTLSVGGAADSAPSTTTSALAAPVIGELTPKPVDNPDVVRVAVRPSKRNFSLPQIGATPETDETTEVAADTPIGVPVEPIPNPLANKDVKVVTGRLPSVGDTPSGASNTFASVTPNAGHATPNALKDHAIAFTTNSQSLFSIVIIDAGQSGVPREHLLNSSYPITIAIDPSKPDASSLMAQYQAAGIEVIALLNDLPAAAAPSDVAVALEGYFNILDKSVAVMEPLDRRLQKDRELLQPVLGSIASSGHGLVTYSQGLNTTQQSAKRAGVPSVAVFRVLDGEDEKAPKIKRYLRRAAFNAGKDGSVVVVGRSYAETMTAILEWALENNDVTISLAPVSAILKADLDPES